MKCKRCGAGLDLTKSSCAACGHQVELGRLTGVLGIVCRACDAYNEPGAKACVGCGEPLGDAAEPAAPVATAQRLAAHTPVPFLQATPRVPPPAHAGAPAARPPPKPAAGAATRFVPAVVRPTAGARPESGPLSTFRPATTPASGAPGPVAGARAGPAHAPPRIAVAAAGSGSPAGQARGGGPIPLVAACPRCGEDGGRGRFCSRCGQPLGASGTQVAMAPLPVRSPQVLAPVAPGRARLVLEGGDPHRAPVFSLDSASVEAGRSRGAVLFPDDPSIAPHHATFFYRDGALHVRDEGAPGGIYLRLRGVSVPLRAGERFVVGGRLLRYAGQLPPPPPGPPDGTRRLGAPRPTPPAVVVEEWLEGGASGRVFVRSGPAVTIGRGGCALGLGDDPQVSQAHAELVAVEDGSARLRDLGSSNGTYVGIPPHAERELRDGDFIRMGRAVLRVAIGE